jgi:hypothetical protein
MLLARATPVRARTFAAHATASTACARATPGPNAGWRGAWEGRGGAAIGNEGLVFACRECASVPW